MFSRIIRVRVRDGAVVGTSTGTVCGTIRGQERATRGTTIGRLGQGSRLADQIGTRQKTLIK